MVHTRGTLVFTVEGYELEIDHDGFTGGGGIFVRLAGQKHVLPVSVTVAKQLGAAIAAVGELAGKIDHAAAEIGAQQSGS